VAVDAVAGLTASEARRHAGECRYPRLAFVPANISGNGSKGSRGYRPEPAPGQLDPGAGMTLTMFETAQ
jgi:hypothetical protein